MARTYRRKNSVIHVDYVEAGLDMCSPEARARVCRLHSDGAWQADPCNYQLHHNRQFRERMRQTIRRFVASGDLLEASLILPKLVHNVYQNHYW